MRHIPQVWLVAGGGWVGRGLQVAAQLIAVRILTDSLGTRGYGAFAVLASLNGWFLLSDFSIAISLQNYISERRSREEDADDLVITAALLSLVAVGVTAVGVLVAGPWLADLLLHDLGTLPRSAQTVAFYAAAFPSIGAALGGVVYKFWFAHHRGYLSNLVPAAGTVLGTFAVWLVHRSHIEPRLAWSLFLYYAPVALLPLAALLAITLQIARRHPFRRDLIRPLLGRAFRFWIFGILAVAVLQVDYIIMAQVLPAQDIVIYNVATRLFLLVFFVYNALLLALWPVCSEAIARNDWDTVFATLRRYMAIGLAFTLACGIAIALLDHWVVRLLVPSLHTDLPLVVVVLLTIYIMVRIWSDTFAMVLQSMNDLKPLWIALPIQSLLSVGLQTLGAHIAGLPGMIAGLTSCFVLTVGWYLPRRCLRHARSGATSHP